MLITAIVISLIAECESCGACQRILLLVYEKDGIRDNYCAQGVCGRAYASCFFWSLFFLVLTLDRSYIN